MIHTRLMCCLNKLRSDELYSRYPNHCELLPKKKCVTYFKDLLDLTKFFISRDNHCVLVLSSTMDLPR